MSTLLPIIQGNPSTVLSSNPPLKNPRGGSTCVVVAAASLVVVVEDTATSGEVVVGTSGLDADEESDRVLTGWLVSSPVEVSLSTEEGMNVISDAVLQVLLVSSKVEEKPLSVVTVLVGCSPFWLEEDRF